MVGRWLHEPSGWWVGGCTSPVDGGSVVARAQWMVGRCVMCTTCSQTTLKVFKKTEFTCVREHEEFVWLHDRFVDNEEYAGIIVSPHTHTHTGTHYLPHIH